MIFGRRRRSQARKSGAFPVAPSRAENTSPKMPIHIAITRRVRSGCETEFQQALRKFFQASFAYGGGTRATNICAPPPSVPREFSPLPPVPGEKKTQPSYPPPPLP